MLRGTRILRGEEARLFRIILENLKNYSVLMNFDPVVIPSIWETSTFSDRVGSETENLMWTFADKKGREVCLIPEVTGIIQEQWQTTWCKEMASLNLYYIQRCYRYERPQKGRYREFTQFGVESLGLNRMSQERCLDVCKNMIEIFLQPDDFRVVNQVKRGLGYYLDDGFEIECDLLGAQKQIAGGGSYQDGCGFAIGVDRLALAMTEKRKF